MVPQWKCLIQIHILSLKTGFWFFCLFCFMFITAHMWVKKYSQWLYCFIAYSINFIFANNGKNKHAHSVYNSTELHMSWTPGAINLLSSKKASKILGLFLGGGDLAEILHVQGILLSHKQKLSAILCGRKLPLEHLQWIVCVISLISPYYTQSGSTVYNCVGTGPAPVGENCSHSSCTGGYTCSPVAWRNLTPSFRMVSPLNRRIKMLPVFPHHDGNHSKCPSLTSAVWSVTYLK